MANIRDVEIAEAKKRIRAIIPEDGVISSEELMDTLDTCEPLIMEQHNRSAFNQMLHEGEIEDTPTGVRLT